MFLQVDVKKATPKDKMGASNATGRGRGGGAGRGRGIFLRTLLILSYTDGDVVPSGVQFPGQQMFSIEAFFQQSMSL